MYNVIQYAQDQHLSNVSEKENVWLLSKQLHAEDTILFILLLHGAVVL